jgi:glucose/arabinose dehydrogenase
VAAGCGGSGGDQGTRGDGRADRDAAVRLERVGAFDQPVYVAQPPGERHDLFVVEQTGRIVRVRDGRTVRQPFLDLSDRVSCCGEQGLLSMAFAPDYERSGVLYVDYTDRAGDTRVVEYRRGPGGERAATETARTVLAVDQPYPNHNGGQLQFGPDGLLYVGLGDGGSEGDPDRVGQDRSSPLAKILRIDPRPRDGSPYSVPADNPFVDSPRARPETFALGLRNPWRFSFDRETGALWIGDVGQSRFEEVDAVAPADAAGANFGWSAFEGDARFNDDQHAPGAVRPVLTYSHDDGCSVTGGYVVRDPSLPRLRGRYVYGDYCAGELRSFVAAPGRRARDDRALGLHVDALSSFGEDSAGHVYVTSLEGPVFRLAGG